MKKKFVDKGIPLVLGEYSAMYRTHPDNSLQEVCHESEGYFTGYVTEQAKTTDWLLSYGIYKMEDYLTAVPEQYCCRLCTTS